MIFLWDKKKVKKKDRTIGGYKCNLCGKIFKNEDYVDNHMTRKHMDNITTESICLADYCDILDCEKIKYENRCHNKKRAERDLLYCKNIFHECFPRSERLEELMVKRFCQPYTCDVSFVDKTEVEIWTVLYYISLGLIILFLLFFYLIVIAENADDPNFILNLIANRFTQSHSHAQ